MNIITDPTALQDGATRPRVAIVSTYDELCGIAGYTRALERQLRPRMDIEVFDLDQYLLRSPHRRVQRLGNDHIREMAAEFAAFDSVNIQLEHGTLGRTPWQVLRRFARLAKAAPALSVTFHTVLSDDPLPWGAAWRQLRRGRIGGAASVLGDNLRARLLGGSIYGLLRRLQKTKPVRVIVHTRRDMRLLRDVYGLRDVFHHPLAFIERGRAAEIRRNATRAQFPLLRALPPDARLVGTFGFLSPYKGFETAVRALRHLPDNHHLLIFGGVHPQTIRRHQPIDSYVNELLREGRIGMTTLDALRESGGARVSVEGGAAELLAAHPADLRARMHFMGVLPDEEFAAAMALCDAVVLPYLEVGQSSSGPVSMAIDMGCRVIATRTLAFLQLARYHPGRIEFFDIGNFAELAGRLLADPAGDPANVFSEYDTRSNAALYVRANAGARGAAVPAA